MRTPPYCPPPTRVRDYQSFALSRYSGDAKFASSRELFIVEQAQANALRMDGTLVITTWVDAWFNADAYTVGAHHESA